MNGFMKMHLSPQLLFTFRFVIFVSEPEKNLSTGNCRWIGRSNEREIEPHFSRRHS
jgi:hypothetical protein